MANIENTGIKLILKNTPYKDNVPKRKALTVAEFEGNFISLADAIYTNIESIDSIKRLQKELEKESAVLRGRVDNLESTVGASLPGKEEAELLLTKKSFEDATDLQIAIDTYKTSAGRLSPYQINHLGSSFTNLIMRESDGVVSLDSEMLLSTLLDRNFNGSYLMLENYLESEPSVVEFTLNGQVNDVISEDLELTIDTETGEISNSAQEGSTIEWSLGWNNADTDLRIWSETFLDIFNDVDGDMKNSEIVFRVSSATEAAPIAAATSAPAYEDSVKSAYTYYRVIVKSKSNIRNNRMIGLPIEYTYIRQEFDPSGDASYTLAKEYLKTLIIKSRISTLSENYFFKKYVYDKGESLSNNVSDIISLLQSKTDEDAIIESIYDDIIGENGITLNFSTKSGGTSSYVISSFSQLKNVSAVDAKIRDCIEYIGSNTPGLVLSLSFDVGNQFPMESYANQKVEFSQATTNGLGSGLSFEVTFDSTGNISSYTLINQGKNYQVNDEVTTNDPYAGTINLKITEVSLETESSIIQSTITSLLSVGHIVPVNFLSSIVIIEDYLYSLTKVLGFDLNWIKLIDGQEIPSSTSGITLNFNFSASKTPSYTPESLYAITRFMSFQNHVTAPVFANDSIGNVEKPKPQIKFLSDLIYFEEAYLDFLNISKFYSDIIKYFNDSLSKLATVHSSFGQYISDFSNAILKGAQLVEMAIKSGYKLPNYEGVVNFENPYTFDVLVDKYKERVHYYSNNIPVFFDPLTRIGLISDIEGYLDNKVTFMRGEVLDTFKSSQSYLSLFSTEGTAATESLDLNNLTYTELQRLKDNWASSSWDGDKVMWSGLELSGYSGYMRDIYNNTAIWATNDLINFCRNTQGWDWSITEPILYLIKSGLVENIDESTGNVTWTSNNFVNPLNWYDRLQDMVNPTSGGVSDWLIVGFPSYEPTPRQSLVRFFNLKYVTWTQSSETNEWSYTITLPVNEEQIIRDYKNYVLDSKIKYELAISDKDVFFYDHYGWQNGRNWPFGASLRKFFKSTYSELVSPYDYWIQDLWSTFNPSEFDTSLMVKWGDSVDWTPPRSVGKEMILHDVQDNKFYRIKFLSWTENGMGGGLSYTRQEIDSTGQPIGQVVNFSKENYATDVDVVSQYLTLKRANEQGLFNSTVASSFKSDNGSTHRWVSEPHYFNVTGITDNYLYSDDLVDNISALVDDINGFNNLLDADELLDYSRSAYVFDDGDGVPYDSSWSKGSLMVGSIFNTINSLKENYPRTASNSKDWEVFNAVIKSICDILDGSECEETTEVPEQWVKVNINNKWYLLNTNAGYSEIDKLFSTFFDNYRNGGVYKLSDIVFTENQRSRYLSLSKYADLCTVSIAKIMGTYNEGGAHPA